MRLDDLLEEFPYFLSRDPSSNFVKSETVFNDWFKDVYNDMFLTYCSHHLSKPILIWKTQEADYDYTMNFVVMVPNIKTITIYEDNIPIYREDYPEGTNKFYYTHDDTSDKIIPDNTYMCLVETYDEFTLVKGFPENDPTDYITMNYDSYTDNLAIKTEVPDLTSVTVYEGDELLFTDDINIDEKFDIESRAISSSSIYQTIRVRVETSNPMIYYEKRWSKTDAYSHDPSLDDLGNSYSMPRKTYSYTHRTWTSDLYPSTEPEWNNRYTEDDYHYMNRMITYVTAYHTTPLPVLELWKLFGVEATMENRNDILCKMYSEKLHGTDWEPNDDYTHKNLQGPTEEDEEVYLLVVNADNTMAYQGTPVHFSLSLYDRYFDIVNLAGPIEVYKNEELIDTITSNEYTISASTGSYQFKDLATETYSETINIKVKGCSDADFYVSTTGDDSNPGSKEYPVKTLSKALSLVEDEKNFIFMSAGDYSITETMNISKSCTIAHCEDGIVNINSTTNTIFNLNKGITLNLININAYYDGHLYKAESDVHKNTGIIPYGVYVIGPEKFNTTLSAVVETTSSTGATVGVVLLDNQSKPLSGMTITDIDTGDTVTTNDSGAATFSYTETAGTKTHNYAFAGDDTYRASSASVTYEIIALTLTSDKTIGETGDIVNFKTNVSGAQLIDSKGTVYATFDDTLTYDYTCTGAGDLELYASYKDALSDPITLEDCLFYDDCTGTCSDKWNQTAYKTVGGYTCIGPNYTILTPYDTESYVFEFDGYLTSTTSDGMNPTARSTISGTDYNTMVSLSAGRYSGVPIRVLDCPVKTLFHVKLVKETYNYKVYVNGTLKGSTDTATYDGSRYLGIGGSGSWGATNIKVKKV